MGSLKLLQRYIQSIWAWDIGPQTIILIGLSIIAALTEGGGLGLLIPVLELLQDNQNQSMSVVSVQIAHLFEVLGVPFTLPILLGIIITSLIGQALMTYVRVLVTAKTQTHLVYRLRSQLFNNLLNFDLAYFHKSRTSDLVNALSTEATRAGSSYAHLVPMAALIILLIVYVTVQLMISWQLTVVTLPILGILALVLRPRESYQLGTEYTSGNEQLQSVALENLGGIREVKILGLETFAQERFNQHTDKLASLEVLLNEKSARFTMVYQSVVFVTVAVMIVFANQVVGLSLAPLLTFLLILQRFAPRVSIVIDYRHWWLGFSHSLFRLEHLIKETDQSATTLVDGQVSFSHFTQAITFHQVDFQYSPEADKVLRQVSLTIPAGKMTAIVGASGAGKSTLMDLIARFHDPSGGYITIDNHKLPDYQVNTWRQCIGMVSQDNFLFNDTIINNIRCGHLQATPDQVEQAARQAHAHEFILQLPEQYNTIVGDRGIRLSGGQRQRLALARALLRKPQILLLDEATSDLDTESERLIQQAIHEVSRSCTVIAIAHRLSTIEHADNIVVLEKGHVVEQGRHQNLLNKNGRYAEYYRLQFGNI